MDNLDTQFSRIKGDLATDEAKLEALSLEIEQLDRTAILTVLQIAARVQQINNIFKYRRNEGGFVGYMQRRLGYSSSAAYRLLDVHKRFGNGECLPNWETLPRSALYLLAAPSTLRKAVEKIAERVEAGEKPGVAEAQKAITEAKRAAKAKAAEGDHKPDTAYSSANFSEPEQAATNFITQSDVTDDQEVKTRPSHVEGTKSAGRRTLRGIWNVGPAEDREIIRDILLGEVFDRADGSEIYDRIPAPRRGDVCRVFLDRLTASGLCRAASPEFRKQLQTRVTNLKRNKTLNLAPESKATFPAIRPAASTSASPTANVRRFPDRQFLSIARIRRQMTSPAQSVPSACSPPRVRPKLPSRSHLHTHDRPGRQQRPGQPS
jgi:hypothetical protein